MKGWIGLLAAAALVVGLGASVPSVSPITNPQVRNRNLDVADQAASASLLGQFRTNLSAWLWLHTDLYLHNGVDLRPITDREVKEGVQVEGAADSEKGLMKEVDVTVIPSASRDFRGVFGDVDRAVSAWKDMKGHTHNDPTQALPLFRLMTWIDPQFIDGWTTGAVVYTWNKSSSGTKNALDFLSEGLRQNPESVDILTKIAYMHITRRKDLSAAIPFLEKARGLGYAHRKSLIETEKDALEDAYRWLGLCYRDSGRHDLMRVVCREGLEIFPDDRPLAKMLGTPQFYRGDTAATVEALKAASG